MLNSSLLTSEAGLAGHPDKVADQIGDAILDAFLVGDPAARVGCQVMLANGVILVGGQVTSRTRVDIPRIVQSVLTDIGYESETEGLSPQSQVIVRIDPQSPNIARGVDRGGAGDSAIVIGYACTETPELMPMPAAIVHQLAADVDKHRRDGLAPWLRPDGKIQATVAYQDGEPVHLDTLVLSVQHSSSVAETELNEYLWAIVNASGQPARVAPETKLLTPATIGFLTGGPKADCGLSGRKVVADTYGGAARHGGGGLSGKDPTKIDRCGMYVARYIAKNLVSSGLARRCEVQLAYVIGMEEPAAVAVDTFGTGALPEKELVELIWRAFPLRPPVIVEELRLRRPMYRQVGLYGHFGHKGPEYSWEECDRASALRAST